MKKQMAVVVLMGVGLLMAAVRASAQCPMVGAATGCDINITINPNLSLTFVTNTGVQPIDELLNPTNADDELIGVTNNSGVTVDFLSLTGGLDAEGFGPFGFDGDGLCSGYGGATGFASPAGCAFDGTGYAGLGTLFNNVSGANFTMGDVNFTGGLANQATAYFSLEDAPTSGMASTSPSPGTPSPATLLLLGSGLLLLAHKLGRR